MKSIDSKIVKPISNIITVVALLTISYFGFAGTALADYSATSTFNIAGNGLFIVPAGVTTLRVDIVGGGGGGAGGAFTYGGGGGGSGSSISNATMSVTPGQTVAYTVGAGGNGGASGSFSSSGGNGADGATSFFGFLIFANGGHGGNGAIINNANGGHGGLSGGVGGTNGTNGDAFLGQRSHGGNGGTNLFGTGGNGGFGNSTSYTLPTAGINGNGGGAGSGWALYASGSDAGARGGNGYIRVSYYADLTAPVITILGSNPTIVPANSVYVDAGATAFDNTFGTTSVTTIFNNVNTSATGTYSVVYSATDGAGNTATSSRTVIVTDQSAPIITAPATQVFEATGPTTTPVLVPATAVDLIDPSPVITYSPSSFTLGTTTVTWTATDSDGNFSTTTSLVVITDTTAPTIVLNGSSTLSFIASSTQIYVDPGATALDLVDGSTPVSIIFNNVDLSATGTYSVVYSSSDLSGNTATSSRTVIVTSAPITDTTAPTTPVITFASATGTIISQADISWTDSTDTQSGVAGYLFVFDGNANTSVTLATPGVASTTATTTSSGAFGTVWFHVAAIDNAGNISTTTSVGPFVISDSAVLYRNSTVGGISYALFSPSLVQAAAASTTGTTTLTNSTLSTFWNVNDSNLVGVIVDDTNLNNVLATSSQFTNSDLTNCTVIFSNVKNYLAVNCYIAFSTIDPSTLYSFINSTSTNSQIYASNIFDSVISNNSYVATSTVSSSTISNSTVTNSNLSSSTIATSTLSNVVDSGSTITNTTLSNATTTNAVIDSGIIYSGTITIGGNTYVISTPTPIASLAATLVSIAITTPANVLTYTVGQALDITGLVVTGTFSDASTSTLPVTIPDVSGFDSSVPAVGQVLTITLTIGTSTATTTYTVDINAVTDTIPPVITIIGSNPLSIVATTTPYVDLGATYTDNVDGGPFAATTTSNNVNPSVVGTYSVDYSATDVAGNTATSSRVVNVIAAPDTTPPVITILGSNPVNIFVGSVYSDAGATANDNVDGNITANIITTNNVNTSATGTYTVDYSVVDSSGNGATSTRTVNVIAVPADIVPPVITITGGTPITITVGSVYTDAGATYTDNIDGGPFAASLVSNNVNTSATGSYQVIYSATDIAGNVATATRDVNVIAAPADTIPPVIFITGGTPLTFQATTTPYADAGATYTDNIDGGPFAATTTSNNVDLTTVGSYQVIYTANDVAGNISTATRDVNVVAATSSDNIPPVITITGGTPITIFVNSTYTDQGVTALDNVDGDVTASIVTTNNVNTAVIGTYTVDYSVTDSSANIATTSRTVNVISAPADTIPPVITVIGGTPTTVTVGSLYTDQGATAFDNVDGTTSVNTISNNVNTAIAGAYQVVYSATDIAGNTATTTRDVNVVLDTVAPTITILGADPATLTVGTTYVDAGATAFDNVDGNITGAIVTSNNINNSVVGSYSFTYTSTDSSGNVASSSRVVNVVPDVVPPVITITGANPVNLLVGAVYVDAGATANDNVDGNITASIVSTSTVDTAVVGVYSVTYSVVDSSGNGATSTRTVNVNAPDTVPPVITILGSNPINVALNSVYVDAGATAVDAVDGPTAVTVLSNNVNTAIVGAYSVVYSSTDIAGNTSTSTRVINVLPDVVPPVITILGSNPITINRGSAYTDAGATAFDAVDGTTTVSATGTVNTAVVGTYTITYTSTDLSGNGATSTRTVNVVNPPSGGGGSFGGGGTVYFPTLLLGDLNNDGKVNKYDFALMMVHWGELIRSVADLNSDNMVNTYDFSILMSNWGKTK